MRSANNASVNGYTYNNAEHRLHGTICNTGLERFGCYVKNGRSGRFGASSRGGRNSDEGFESLGYRQPFTNRGVDKIEEVGILINREPVNSMCKNMGYEGLGSYKLAAFAVSITLPPPTLHALY